MTGERVLDGAFWDRFNATRDPNQHTHLLPAPDGTLSPVYCYGEPPCNRFEQDRSIHEEELLVMRERTLQ